MTYCQSITFYFDSESPYSHLHALWTTLTTNLIDAARWLVFTAIFNVCGGKSLSYPSPARLFLFIQILCFTSTFCWVVWLNRVSFGFFTNDIRYFGSVRFDPASDILGGFMSDPGEFLGTSDGTWFQKRGFCPISHPWPTFTSHPYSKMNCTVQY